MIRVMLPAHLRTLSGATGDVTLEVAPPVTVRALHETARVVGPPWPAGRYATTAR